MFRTEITFYKPTSQDKSRTVEPGYRLRPPDSKEKSDENLVAHAAIAEATGKLFRV
jgi:hypothetical protein